uniref:Uncharacterized protein n=1 Tax=Tetranychus urticae TaxID=32264 RepID=T1KXG3_TETUR
MTAYWQRSTNWLMIGQFSSIGSLGAKSEAWLRGEFLQISIFGVADVRISLEGCKAGGSLPSSDSNHQKKLYLQS